MVTGCFFCIGRDAFGAAAYQLLGLNLFWFGATLIKFSLEGCARRARPGRGAQCRMSCAALCKAPAAAMRVPWFLWFTPLAHPASYIVTPGQTEEKQAAEAEAFNGETVCIGPAVAGMKADRVRQGHPFLGVDGRAVWGSPPVGKPLADWGYALAKLWHADDRLRAGAEGGAAAAPAAAKPVISAAQIAAQLARMRAAAGRTVYARAALVQVSQSPSGEGGRGGRGGGVTGRARVQL